MVFVVCEVGAFVIVICMVFVVCEVGAFVIV